jgi:hypothetical protein
MDQSHIARIAAQASKLSLLCHCSVFSAPVAFQKLDASGCGFARQACRPDKCYG